VGSPPSAGTDPGGLLRGLTPSQRAAVGAPVAPLCVVAGAGSGKTTVLTRRVARRVLEGSARPEHILVVTFTRKAAAEVRDRLRRLGVPAGVRAGTFHAIAFAQLRRHWADRDLRPPTLLRNPAALVQEILQDRQETTPDASIPDAGSLGARALSEIHWAQVRMLEPRRYADAAARTRRPLVGGATYDEVAELYDRYQRAKRRRGVLDLDDLVATAGSVLEEDGEAAAALRWRTRHLFVDEFQDLNPAQWRLLAAWLGDGRDLFVVGDPRQAIYGWNGADPSLLERLPAMVPGMAVIDLDDNHRSTPQVVSAASAVLGADPPRTSRPDGPPPLIRSFPDDELEAAALVRWLRSAHRPGFRWSRLAVLARTHARLEPVARTLSRAGIPYRRVTDPPRTDLPRDLTALRHMAPRRRLRGALAELVVQADAGVAPGDTQRDRFTTLRTLADEHAIEFPDATVGEFLDWIAAADAGGAEADTADAVALSSFHRAKGLEWTAVAVVGLEDGLVPIVHARTPGALAEERRLLYVALSRAEEQLWCSWARTRGDRQPYECRASPFLEALDAAAGAPVTGSGRRAARVAALRAALPDAG
jgi:DNA helicase II / ATP-dependent DNA helicase PcrA